MQAATVSDPFTNGVASYGPAPQFDSAVIAGYAREAVENWIGSDHPALYGLQLVTSELVTNAIRYGFSGAAHDTVTVRLAVEVAFFRLTVTDPGAARSVPNLRPLTDMQETGRGLWLVDNVTHSLWGSHRTAINSRVVWALIPKIPW